MDQRNTVAVCAQQLTVVNGPEQGRGIALPPLPCRIGRGGDSAIVLRDPDDPPALSREHATLAWRGDDLLVTDHSINGTLAGARWLTHGETGILAAGETLQLGPTLRLLRAGRGAISPAAATAPFAARRVPAATAQAAPRVGDLRAFLTAPATLQAAWRRVELNRGAAGPDNVTVADYGQDADRRLAALRQDLMRGRYEPLPPRLYAAPKRAGGVRAISILRVQDRIVQHALHAALSPLLEPGFPPCSYAYRPGLSAHDALRAVDALLRAGLNWVAEADIAAFFDHISHRTLLEKLADRVADPFVLSLVARCLAAGSTTPGMGIAQGAATSPLFSNLYLAEFDAELMAAGWNPVRYGDDMLCACRDRAGAQAALSQVEGALRARLALALRADKTGIVTLAQGFTFLGFRFTESGRQVAPEAVAHLEERLAETTGSTAAAVARGWKNYFGAPPATPASVHAAAPERKSALTAEERERFLALFGGREDVYARQSAVKGKTRFMPCAGALDAALLTAHLEGRETLAAYLIRTDGAVRHLVLDIDRKNEPGAESGARKGGKTPDLGPVIDFARRLQQVCRDHGAPAMLEDSGRRGRHLWLFFSEPVAPEAARRLGRLLAVQAGFPCPGVRLEILPRHTEWPGPELGDAVKLPFGVHPLTGRRCLFLDAEERPIADVAAALAQIRTLDAARVEAITAALARGADANRTPTADAAPTPHTGAVSQLVGGCSVVRALAERARQTGHLRHTHQLILLYTAGHLGAEGAAYIHRVIAQCGNYDPAICQSYIDRLDAKHPPIGCRRIREWLEEEGETNLCTCPSNRRTPLELVTDREPKPAARRPPQKPAPRALPLDGESEVWRSISEELFD